MIQNHFTATGIVFNDRQEVLMIYHKKLRVWLPPGGHIEENELPHDAALREVLEETGVNARIIRQDRALGLIECGCAELPMPFTLLLEDIEGDGLHNHIDLIYLCRAAGGDLRPQEDEVEGIGWFTYEEIKGLDTYENVIKTAKQAVDYMKRSC